MVGELRQLLIPGDEGYDNLVENVRLWGRLVELSSMSFLAQQSLTHPFLGL